MTVLVFWQEKMDNFEKWGYLGSVNDENKPKIFKNDSDSAPKVGEEYGNEIEEIINNQIEVECDEIITDYLEKNDLREDLSQLIGLYRKQLDQGIPLTLTLKREYKTVKGRIESIGQLEFLEDIKYNIGNLLEKELKPHRNRSKTQVETYFTITSDPERFRKYKIKAWQVEYPARGNGTGELALINEGYYFSKDLTGEEFVKVMEEK